MRASAHHLLLTRLLVFAIPSGTSGAFLVIIGESVTRKKRPRLGLLFALAFPSRKKDLVQKSMITPLYNISFEKEDSLIKVSYDVSVPAGGSALLADFKLYVAGKNLLKDDFHPGQTVFKSSVQYDLEHPDKDVNVGYSLATSEGWSKDDSDILRGDKRFDDASFRNP